MSSWSAVSSEYHGVVNSWLICTKMLNNLIKNQMSNINVKNNLTTIDKTTKVFIWIKYIK